MDNIRQAQPNDIEDLVALLSILFEAEEDFVPNPKKQHRALAILLDTPSAGVVLVFCAEGQLIGMVSLLFTVSTAEGGRACWLEDLVVRSEWRGCGVGSALLAAAIAEARSRSLLRIALLTDRTNVTARRFYARHCFTESNMVPMRLNLPADKLQLNRPAASTQ